MTDFNVALAKKQLARELKILVIVQVVALCIAGLGLFLFGSEIVPNYPAWDTIHSLCGMLGMSGIVVFVVVAIWGTLKLTMYYVPWLITVSDPCLCLWNYCFSRSPDLTRMDSIIWNTPLYFSLLLFYPPVSHRPLVGKRDEK